MSDIKRILLVDDEKRILQTFSSLLEDNGYYVKTASNPDDALRLVSEDKFDIAFLDQFLGTITGLELMRQMSDGRHDLYYVIITAHGSADLATEALKKGASDFITKPFFVADLIKSIDYVNKKRELDSQKKKILQTLEKKVNERTDELYKTNIAVLSSLAQAIEKRDLGTYGHCKRVSLYCDLIAVNLSLDTMERHYLSIAAMLHDIGKIGISDFILGKTERLTYEELNDIRSHPVKGVEILSPLRYLKPTLPAILHHHENYDGSGYPFGISEEEIPLPARIIAVADAYDAILSNRPYRSASNHNEAISELTRYSSRQFDPNIVNVFLDINVSYIENQI